MGLGTIIHKHPTFSHWGWIGDVLFFLARWAVVGCFFVFLFAFFLSFLRVVVRWLNLNWPRPYLLLRRFQLGLGLAGGRVIGGHSASLITRSVTVYGWLRPGVSCGFTFLVCGGLYRSRGVCLNRGVDRHLRWH